MAIGYNPYLDALAGAMRLYGASRNPSATRAATGALGTLSDLYRNYQTSQDRGFGATTQGRTLSGAGAVLGGLNALDPNAPIGSRALSGLGAANQAYQAYSGESIPYAKDAINAAALGYSLAQIAGDDRLSQTQKMGQASRAAFGAGVSYIPIAGQIYAAAQLGRQLGEGMERSGSPQVRGLGRTIHYAATPAGENAGWDVFTGMRSPRAAFKAAGGLQGLTLDMMGPMGLIFRGLGVDLPGFHSGPRSEGGVFRQGLGRAFDKIGLPINLNFQDRSTYEAPVAQGVTQGNPNSTIENWTAKVGKQNLDTGMQFSQDLMRSMGQDPTQNVARQTQMMNVLLNNYGSNIGDQYKKYQDWVAAQQQQKR